MIVLYNIEPTDEAASSSEDLMVGAGRPDFSPSFLIANKKNKLKSTCCEKHKKGRRCKRCPCFDLR